MRKVAKDIIKKINRRNLLIIIPVMVIALGLILSLSNTNIRSLLGDAMFPGGSSSTEGTADHIDIGIDTEAVLVIAGKTITTNVTLDDEDFQNGNVTLTAMQNEEEFTNFTMNTSDLSTSTGSSGIKQIRIGGSYPSGTLSNPVYYTLTLKKEVEFTDSDTLKTYTMFMTFSATFNYWDDDNDCPGLSNNWNTGSGTFSSAGGMDFTLSASSSKAMLSIYKYVVDENGEMIDASNEEFNFTVYDEDDEEVESVVVTTSSSGIGVATIDVEEGNYYVVEDSYPESIGYMTYDKEEIDGEEKTDSTSSVKEATVDTSPTYTFTSYYAYEKTSVTVSKVWNDNNDNLGLRPSSVDVYLYRDNEIIDRISLSKDNNWTYTFSKLDKYDNNGEITYKINEVSVDNYETEIENDGNNYTITNTLKVGNLKLVKKVVSTTNNSDNFIFKVSGFSGISVVSDNKGNTYNVEDGAINVTIKADEEIILTAIPIGSYTVKETGVDDNTLTTSTNIWMVSGGGSIDVERGKMSVSTITNTEVIVEEDNSSDDDSQTENNKENDNQEETITVTGEATWDLDGEEDVDLPESITIRLYKNDEEVDTDEVTEEDNWVWTFDDIEDDDSTYIITEDAIDDFSTTYSATTITNLYTPGQTSVTVSKVWNDDGNTSGVRPEKVTVKLYADGVDTGLTITLSDDNNWKNTFTNLDQTDSEGKTIVYTINEVLTANYTTTITGDMTKGFIISNTLVTTSDEVNPDVETTVDSPSTSNDSIFSYILMIAIAVIFGLLIIVRRKKYL